MIAMVVFQIKTYEILNLMIFYIIEKKSYGMQIYLNTLIRFV